MSVIVIEFVTLDGIVEDPDGRGGTPGGGWAFRQGGVAGDKFGLGPVLDESVLLLGRTTWQLFAGLWPNRQDPFSVRMNQARKLVASRTLTDVAAWQNSMLVEGDLIDAVKREPGDVVITGSIGIVHTLMAHDLVDEYRLLTFPTALGAGRPLFPAGNPPTHLRTLSTEPAGPAVLTRYAREVKV